MIQPANNYFGVMWNTDIDGNKISISISNEQHIVVGSSFLLSQIPDINQRVFINGLVEIDFKDKIEVANQFKVDYNYGVVYVHDSKEGQTINVTQYSGRGIIKTYADRIEIRNEDKQYGNKILELVLKESAERINNLIINADIGINEVNGRVDNLILNQGNSPAEVADARIDSVKGDTYALLKDRLDNMSFETRDILNTTIPRVESKLADISRNIVAQSDLENTISLNARITCNIGKKIEINSNMTIPSHLTLNFNNDGIIKIKSGVTLVVNSRIEAEHKQIFEFEDDTAEVTTYNTWELWVDRPKVHDTVKLDWFGAKGDALFSWDTHTVVVGNDDTKAIKRAMKFVEKASTKNKAGYLVRQPVIVEGRPSATYYVQGNNILSQQDPSISGIHFEFRGNGCVFYHHVSEEDKFIDNFGKLYKSSFKNFDVLPFGEEGKAGYFVNSSEQITSSNNGGVFENIVVGQLNYRTGYRTIFNITSIDMLDNFYVKRCRLMNCNKIYYNTNVEAMGWKFDKCYMAGGSEGSVFLHSNCNLGGGFTVEDCEVLFTHANQTFFKLENQVTEENFKISCRVETHTSNITLIDIDGGSVDARGINMINGSGGYIPSGVISAKVTKTGFVRFTDSIVSENFLLDCKINDAMYYENALEINNCGYWQQNYLDTPYPIIKFIKPDSTVITHKELIASDYSSRGIAINSHRLHGTFGMAELPISYGGKSKKPYTYELCDKVAGSKTVAPQSNTSLPPYINIRSLKVKLYNKNLANVDTIKIIVGSIATAYPDYTVTVNLSTYVNNSEILVNKYVACPLNKFIAVQYFKGAVQVTDTSLIPSSSIEFQYSSAASLNECLNVDYVHEIALA